ncbi:MAG: hypothetical protein H7196_03790 [candidate division SR1 bacterium]|nr:hypothetical protein [candidate division SR1 bacterium]
MKLFTQIAALVSSALASSYCIQVHSQTANQIDDVEYSTVQCYTPDKPIATCGMKITRYISGSLKGSLKNIVLTRNGERIYVYIDPANGLTIKIRNIRSKATSEWAATREGYLCLKHPEAQLCVNADENQTIVAKGTFPLH